MARFSIIDPHNVDSPYFTYIGIGDTHTHTEWVCAKDVNFKNIIDQSSKEDGNLLYWETPLPKRPEDKEDPNAEEFYSELRTLYVKVRIWCGESVSPWIVLGPVDQTIQPILLTDKGYVVETTDTVKLKWTKELK